MVQSPAVASLDAPVSLGLAAGADKVAFPRWSVGTSNHCWNITLGNGSGPRYCCHPWHLYHGTWDSGNTYWIDAVRSKGFQGPSLASYGLRATVPDQSYSE